MCGITGFVDRSRSTPAAGLESAVRSMASTLEHRGPDDGGSWVDEATGVALGFRRLAILDLSPTGHQPMVSASGRRVLVFNGEIYNYRQLRQELAAAGVRFRSTSDTEVLLEAIERWGFDDAIARTNGMFAVALWDRQRHELWLARDRLGEKPLYYGEVGGSFAFASELKALRAHPGSTGSGAEVDRGALTLFLRHGHVPAPLSIWRGIRKLPPATTLRVRLDPSAPTPEPVPYWSVRGAVAAGRADPFSGAPDEAVDAVEQQLADSVGKRMVADVPLGAFLSGGTDSSTVVALMQAQSTRPVQTFTIGFTDPAWDEAPRARDVAKHLGTDHTELYVTAEEAQEVIPRLPTVYDEPFADSSQIPTLLVSALARRSVTVSLSGDGGDELFGGYTRYFSHWGLWRRVERLPRPARRGLAGVLAAVPRGVWDGLAGRPGVPEALRQRQLADKVARLAGVLEVDGPGEVYRRLMSQWDDPAALVVGGHEPSTRFDDPSRWDGSDGTDVGAAAMALDTETYLPDDLLVKVDRATMAHSLEARVPMLDHRLVELAWRLPEELKIRDGQGKWVLRQVLRRHLPVELVEQPKAGFGIPFGDWLRGPLRPWAEELLDGRRLADEGFLVPEQIRQRWQEHLSGAGDWRHHLWNVLMFQAWLEAQR